MKNKRILLYFILTILVVGILTTGIVNSLSDLSTLIGTGSKHVGEVFKLSYLTIYQGDSAYCIQKDKTLRSNEHSYILKNYIEIDGNESLVYSSASGTPSVVTDNLNGQIAYILNKKQGYGSHENPTDGQRALWHIFNSWTTSLFGEDNLYEWDDNAEQAKITLNTEAEEYADGIGTLKTSDDKDTSNSIEVIDKTDKEKISVKDSNGYYQVGPFRWEFDAELKEIIVSSDKGDIESSNLRFVKYSGTTPNVVNVSEILTGEAFYIEIDKSTEISKLTGLTLKTKTVDVELVKIYTAKIWLFQTKECQNLLYVDVGDVDVEPAQGKGSEKYDIEFEDEDEISVGVIKVDDREGNKPLEKVGFTFSATIETYDVVSQKDHYKEVNCTHIVKQAYTDEKGVQHPAEYQHTSDRVLDWTQYEYKWVEHTMYVNSKGKWGDKAHTYYTDENGKLPIENIKYPTKTIKNETFKGSSYTSIARLKKGTKVTATEVENPHYGYNIGKTYSININEDAEDIEYQELPNHQELVKLSGYVWIDNNAEKTSIRNDLYDEGEQGLNGITVYLRDLKGKEVKRTITSDLGIYSEIEGGQYIFEDVDLDELEAGNYYVEFEYCGITYQSVDAKVKKSNGSKAMDTTTRNKLDAKFASVEGNGTQSLKIDDVTVNYNEIANGQSRVNDCSGCEIYARTNEPGVEYDLYSTFKPTDEEIRNINLGLIIKTQTDFAIIQDLYDVKVDVNGFSHIYRYANVRYNENGTINEESAWNLGVKFQNNMGTYNRAIYTADAEYEAPNHKDNELKVYVTYRVDLRNESTLYLGKVNSIVEYCDSRYNMVAVGTSIDEKDNITGTENITYSEKMKYNDEYSKYIIDVNLMLEPYVPNSIYVKYEMDREAVLEVLNNGELLNNVVEINSYTTFKNNDKNTPVAVVDKDSVPGNTVPGSFDTYEDDNDAARSLQLELTNARALTGTVFVDSTGKDINTVYKEQERLGNGIFDNGESTVAGVTVTLREIGKDDSSYDGERVEMETVTDENGNFEFVGYIPGNYTVTYTWGSKEYKVQYYKGTIYDESRKQDEYWYKEEGPRKTDALDSKEIREAIDNEMEALKYNTLQSEIEKAYDSGSEKIKITSMDSTTPRMTFSVEYDTTITDGTVNQVRFTVKDVDFGIVERPKQKLELENRVSGFKITLANGQVLVDAEITEDGKLKGQYDYTTYMGPSNINGINAKGRLRAEMDTELIQGATLEITYKMKATNISELDYSSDKYYYYGNKENSDCVRLSARGVVDYVDGKLSVVDDNWQEKDKTYLEQVNASKKDDNNYLNSTTTYMTSKLSEELAPGDTKEVDLHTSKLLAVTDENTFENRAEIVEIAKSDAFNTGSPVEITWENGEYYFNVADSETVIIIPNTGDDKGFVLPTIIGITTLLVLAAGIVVIKKFVVNNK